MKQGFSMKQNESSSCKADIMFNNRNSIGIQVETSVNVNKDSLCNQASTLKQLYASLEALREKLDHIVKEMGYASITSSSNQTSAENSPLSKNKLTGKDDSVSICDCNQVCNQICKILDDLLAGYVADNQYVNCVSQ